MIRLTNQQFNALGLSADEKRILKNQQRPKEDSPFALQNLLLLGVHDHNLPEPVFEYQFHPGRQWKVDAAWLDYKLALEIEGGIWMQTANGRSKGHAHPARFLSDMEKYNELAITGWRLLRVTPDMVKDGTAVELLKRVLL